MPLVNPIISGVAPIKVGGAANAGAGLLASAFDHIHPLTETSGPTNMSLGDILDGDGVRRIASAFVGRAIRANSITSGVSTSVVTASDVSSALTFSLLPSNGACLALWLLSYSTALATTGIMLSANFTGTSSSSRRVAVLTATGASTIYSESALAFDTLLGNATVGAGATARLALVFCRVGVTAPGDLSLRYATGVAGSAVTIGAGSGGILIQQ
jgi:hypothetical protein